MRGSLLDLVVDTQHCNHFEAARLIQKFATNKADDLADRLAESLKAEEPIPEFPRRTLDRMVEQFWTPDNPGREYMYSRGFDDYTLRRHNVGYSAKKNMVGVPMYDINGRPIGLIGRRPSATDKAFKNSWKLPTSRTLWNIHNAKREGDTVIICEASFDGMRIDQAGYPNVVATLSGNFSPFHIEQIDRHFSTVIIMTDMDDPSKHTYENCRICRGKDLKSCRGHNPGRSLGLTIAKHLPRKQILWASHEPGMIYPHSAKDAGDMTDLEISTCIKNAVTNFTYNQWNIVV
jgi:hypothetical protein